MNNTVTLSQLITRLAAKTGTDPNTTRRFLRTFFASIEEALIEGQSVTINGIGTFRRPADALESTAPVVFVPDATLAQEINAPFAMFEPVELAEGVDFAPVDEADTPPEEPEAESEAESEAEPEAAEPVSEPEAAAQAAPVVPHVAPAEKPKIEEPYVVPLGAADDEEEDDKPKPVQPKSRPHSHTHHHHYSNRQYAPKKKPNNNLWILGAIVIAVVCVAAYFAAIYVTSDEFQMYNYDSDEPLTTETAEESAPVFDEVSVDEINAQPVAPVESKEGTAQAQQASEEPTSAPAAASQSEPRTDTVTSTRYLATMARQYYGKSIYWVFIYQANADHLHNPNRIKPGTKVVIPEKESFMEATDEATMRKAEKIKVELDRCFN